MKANALELHLASSERTAWVQIVLSLLTQVSSLAAFPSYNVVLGFWGLYSVFSRSLMQAIQAYVGLLFFSTVLDIAFCLIWGRNDIDAGIVFEGYTAKFCLAMLVLDMLAKCTAIRSSLRLYKEIEEAGAIHHRDDTKNRSTTTRHGQPTKPEQGEIGETDGGAYAMWPWSQERATIESPQGRNDIDARIVFEGNTAKFCLAMLVLDMLAKCTAIRSSLRLYKEIEEAGAIHHRDDTNNRSITTRHGQPTKPEQGEIDETGRGAYDMGPWSTRRQDDD